MDELRIILNGHGHNVLQYIKSLIDQTEKDGNRYSVHWVLYGIVVIGHVYTMILCQYRSIERAKAASTRAIGLYIEFIAQISMIESCSGTYTPYTIGCKDAAQFVYKKIFPEMPPEDTVPDVSAKLGGCPPDITIVCRSHIDVYLETLHEYKQIIHNMVQVLFSKELFHDNANIDGKPSYYIEVIGRILEVNTTLEQIPISLSSYRNIVSSQCANNNMGVHTELMSPLEYSKWLHEIICQ
jgi:hypothetical protein